jgi:hypothetical protein
MNKKLILSKTFIDSKDPSDPIFPGNNTVRRLICHSKIAQKKYLEVKKGQSCPSLINGQIAQRDYKNMCQNGITLELLNKPIFENAILETQNILSTISNLEADEYKYKIPYTKRPDLGYCYPYKIKNMNENDTVQQEVADPEDQEVGVGLEKG